MEVVEYEEQQLSGGEVDEAQTKQIFGDLTSLKGGGNWGRKADYKNIKIIRDDWGGCCCERSEED